MKTISNCQECGGAIDWDGDGGFLWEGLTFCDQHDPERPLVETYKIYWRMPDGTRSYPTLEVFKTYEEAFGAGQLARKPFPEAKLMFEVVER
jgi:hypothetical protein